MTTLYFPQDSYATPDGQAGPVASRVPSLFFTWKVFFIIRHDGRLALAGRYHASEWSAGSFGTVKTLERAGVRLHVEGMSAIDAFDGPCVFVANHMSTLETFVLPCFIQPRKPVTFVVKESLTGYPWFGPVLKSREPIIIKRRNAREDFGTVMEQGCERLGRGMSVIIFPQSTRSTTVEPERFNSIGIKLARKAGVPVVPVALRTDAWKVGRFIKDYGGLDPSRPVHFAFGKPIMRVEGNGRAEHAAVCDFIADRLRQWFRPEQGGPASGPACRKTAPSDGAH